MQAPQVGIHTRIIPQELFLHILVLCRGVVAPEKLVDCNGFVAYSPQPPPPPKRYVIILSPMVSPRSSWRCNFDILATGIYVPD